MHNYFNYLPDKEKRKCVVKNSDGKECGVEILGKNLTNLKPHICKLHLKICAKFEKAKK